MITLRPIQERDVDAVASWPAYQGDYAQMDYALRRNGWLHEFIRKPSTWCYMAECETQPVGFTFLSVTREKEAEVRIALHPDKLGQGYGNQVMPAILAKGFSGLGLNVIHLIVRKNNIPAMKLYAKLGFMVSGECTRTIEGRSIDFFEMRLHRRDFKVIQKGNHP